MGRHDRTSYPVHPARRRLDCHCAGPGALWSRRPAGASPARGCPPERGISGTGAPCPGRGSTGAPDCPASQTSPPVPRHRHPPPALSRRAGQAPTQEAQPRAPSGSGRQPRRHLLGARSRRSGGRSSGRRSPAPREGCACPSRGRARRGHGSPTVMRRFRSALSRAAKAPRSGTLPADTSTRNSNRMCASTPPRAARCAAAQPSTRPGSSRPAAARSWRGLGPDRGLRSRARASVWPEADLRESKPRPRSSKPRSAGTASMVGAAAVHGFAVAHALRVATREAQRSSLRACAFETRRSCTKRRSR
jgi:hypothetical protein